MQSGRGADPRSGRFASEPATVVSEPQCVGTKAEADAGDGASTGSATAALRPGRVFRSIASSARVSPSIQTAVTDPVMIISAVARTPRRDATAA